MNKNLPKTTHNTNLNGFMSNLNISEAAQKKRRSQKLVMLTIELHYIGAELL